MKEILVCNCGSSSLKIEVFRVSEQPHSLSAIASAIAERLGSADATVRIQIHDTQSGDGPQEIECSNADHRSALELIHKQFLQSTIFPEENRLAVGHRVVHGGPFIKTPVPLDEENIAIIERCSEFAPLHNPVNLIGIQECAKLFGVPQVGVFDTAFHASIPPEAYTYALPRELVEKHGLRRFGFHGTSHEYCARLLRKKFDPAARDLNFITMHLGNGASVCAISDGRSIDTSMGFTPLEGLVMGTRSGDLDPALLEVLVEKEGLSIEEVSHLLNKKSGLKGICGHSDMRDILAARSDQPKDSEQATLAELALNVFCYRAKKYLGAYTAALGGEIQAIAFTAGIGENAPEVRARILSGMQSAGIILDAKKNQSPPPDGEIQAENSGVRVFVIPADEELAIAEKTLEVIQS